VRHGGQRRRTPAGGGFEEITLPVKILREMNVVDTPGTNAVIEGHEALARDFVPRSDLVLFVTSADRPFTASERAFLEAIRDWGKKVVVAINKVDILETRQDIDKVIGFVGDSMRTQLGIEPEIAGGFVLGGVLVAVGGAMVAMLRRREQTLLRERLGPVRQRLGAAVRAVIEKGRASAAKSARATMDPFETFVRSESAKLRTRQAELARLGADLGALRRWVEGLR